MNIDDFTIGQFKEISAFLNKKITTEESNLFTYNVGDKIFIRTVTLYYVGIIKEIKGQWIILDNASWICDTGRFHDFLKDGKCNEYESFISAVSIPMGSIIDVTRWDFALFTGQK